MNRKLLLTLVAALVGISWDQVHASDQLPTPQGFEIPQQFQKIEDAVQQWKDISARVRWIKSEEEIEFKIPQQSQKLGEELFQQWKGIASRVRWIKSEEEIENDLSQLQDEIKYVNSDLVHKSEGSQTRKGIHRVNRKQQEIRESAKYLPGEAAFEIMAETEASLETTRKKMWDRIEYHKDCSCYYKISIDSLMHSSWYCTDENSHPIEWLKQQHERANNLIKEIWERWFESIIQRVIDPQKEELTGDGIESFEFWTGIAYPNDAIKKQKVQKLKDLIEANAE